MQNLTTLWRSAHWLATIATFLLLTACSGGGGGGGGDSNSDGGFTVSATSLSFTADQKGLRPPSQSIQTSFTHPEATYVGAAYPPGVPPASWLAITSSSSGNSYTFQFSVNSTDLSPGIYTTKIGLGIARADASIIAYKLVDVSYTVKYDGVVTRLTTNFGEIYIWPSVGMPSTGLLSHQRQVVNGVYDGALIHRVIPGYVIQGGEYDINYNPISPFGAIEIDYTNSNKNILGAVGLTKTISNNSPGFFFNLDNNHHLDLTQNGGYEVIGNLDGYSRTQESVRKMLGIPRLEKTFDGPDASYRPTSQIRFFGNLSSGNLQTTIQDVVVYDSNGDPRTLTLLFVNNAMNVQGEWLVTVTDATNTINKTEKIRFQVNGNIEAGYNKFIITNPAIQGGTPVDIEFYFGEPDSYTVTNFSGGTTSTIVIADVDGMLKPDGYEQPQQNIIIQKAELLRRDYSLPNPSQTTAITLAGNLTPSDSNYATEFEFYSSGFDDAGTDSLMRLSFTNQNDIQTGQWLLKIYWTTTNTIMWGPARILLFDANGNLLNSSKIISLVSNGMFDIYLNIGNIKSINTGISSNISVSSLNGNSRWDQYVPITPDQFKLLVDVK